jgi:serine protease Do
MKLSTRSLSVLFCLAATASFALAADPEVKKELRVIAGPDDDRPKVPVTFLGVETGPTSRTLTEQLGLEADTGLVVDSVAPDSPAAAVLKPHDILVKLDDQKLIETRQLSVLIRGHKEGDEVTLTYLRGGKEATAKVKLAKHDLPPMGRFHLERFGPGDDSLRPLGENSGLPREEMDRILPLIDMGREMHAQVIHSGPAGTEEQEVTTVNTNNSNLVLTDEAGTLEVKVADGKKDVIAKNAKGEVVFSGPFNTEAERQAAPPEVRQRLDKLERMEGVRFKADADFHPGESDMAVPPAHRILYRQLPTPARAPLLPPPQVL